MRYYILSLIACLSFTLSAATWQTFTNTNHVYDINIDSDTIYISSWGGVVKLVPIIANPQDLSNYREESVINTGNGLGSNDIRSLAHIGFNNSLWLGSSDAGVTIMSSSGNQYLSTSLGLPSIKVSKLIENTNTVLVATAGGLASYYYIEGVSFPLMLNQYTSQNTSGGLADNRIEDMALSADSLLFVATSTGLSCIPLSSLNNDSAWRKLNGNGSPILSGVSSRLALSATKVAVAQDATLYLNDYDLINANWIQYNANNLLTGKKISSVEFDDHNNLWVSYGAWQEDTLKYALDSNILLTTLYADGTVKHWNRGEVGLGQNVISNIVFLDGKLFLCTWGDGIYQFVGGEWVNFNPSGISFPKITQIVTDKNNAVWIGSGFIDNQPVKKGSLVVCKLENDEWQPYNIHNSPIHSDNILTVAVDNRNRKWFGTWDNYNSPSGWLNGLSIYDESQDIWKHLRRSGISTWNDETQSWGAYSTSATLLTGTISGIYPASEDNMLVLCYDGGVTVVNSNDEKVTDFRLPNSVYQRSLYAYFDGEKYFIGTNNDQGLVIWNHPSLPETDGIHWVIPSPPELRNCVIYGVATIETPYEGKQHWVAASTGLFMWNGTKWYRYDTMIKRFKYNESTATWVNDILYYENEERLFGSVRTTPTAIMLDPFNHLWIGSLEYGLSMYNPETERFTNFYKPNSPLLSNNITALGYDPVGGRLLIGTPDGLNTLKIGRTVKPETALKEVKAFPNPFRPAKDFTVQIANLPEDSLPQGTSTCRIYDNSGALVMVIPENRFSRFEWNGLSTSGKECGSGVYLFVVTDAQGNSKRGKIALIR